MSAHADDLRYFYSEDIGDSVQAAAAAGASTLVAGTEALELGRYELRCLDFGGASALWVRLGKDNVAASAATPSTQFLAHTDAAELNKPLLTFMVRPGRQYLAVFPVGGTGATVQLTKVSRGKG